MASDPVAADDIGGHQREGAEADAEDKNIDHRESSRRGWPAMRRSMEKPA
jgi:hypothetical protein